MRNTRKKRVNIYGYIIIFVLLTFIGVLFFIGNKDTINESTDVSEPAEIEEGNSSERLITQILSLSQKGKLIDIPFVAGETTVEQVSEEWGEAESINEVEVEVENYAGYPNQQTVVGFKNDIVFDIRSFHSEIQSINLDEIKQISGEPDEILYDEGGTSNQVIWIYDVEPDYQLKWIFPTPTDSVPNPKVDQVAITAQIENKQDAISVKVSNMTLQEKIGQLFIAGISGTAPNQQSINLINDYKIGGFIFYANNLETPQQTIQLLNQLKAENAKNNSPLLLSVDQEGGEISRLPSIKDLPTNEKIGQVNNPQFSYEIGRVLGKELRSFGFNINYAPVLDVNSNPNNPIIGNRSFGNSASTVSELGIQTMQGIQSEKIIPVIKHFPGHGDTSVDSHLELPTVNKSLEELNEMELIPFKRAIDNGADAVMIAHILLPQLDPEYPSSMSQKLITGILRKDLGFEGVVITDDMMMKAITNNFGIEKAAILSIKAGSDIILIAHENRQVLLAMEAIKTEVENGGITEERIDASVTRILRLKEKYEISDEEIEDINIDELNQSVTNILDQYLQ